VSRQLELMQLHDSELPPERAAELEGELTQDELDALEGLEQLGDVVQALAEEMGDPASDISDVVMARIDAGEAKPLTVVEGGAEGSQRPAASERTVVRRLVVGASIALAAAAAAVLWVSAGAGPTPSDPVAVSPQPTRAPVAQPVPVETGVEAEDESSPAAAIEAVDFGSQPGSIFLVPAGEQTTPVVWLVDESTDARMEPL